MPKTTTTDDSISRFEIEPEGVETTRVIKVSDEQAMATGRDCLVCIYGGPVGRRFELDNATTTIGRGGDCELIIQHDTVSRRHAQIVGSRLKREVMDLKSTNGVYVNGDAAHQQVLVSGDYLKIGEVIFKYLSGDNIETTYYEEIYRLAIEDGLTRIPNKRYMKAFLEREFSRALRYERPMSLMLMDLDHFKNVNDTYGHLAGDEVLAQLAQIIAPRIRKEECFSRYGGEEFCLVMPETELEGAAQFANTLREKVDEHLFLFENQVLPVTMSVGVSPFLDQMKRPEDLIKSADDCLYRAKRSGRNKVVYLSLKGEHHTLPDES